MTVGVDRLRPLLAAHLPDYRSADIRCLGAGVDHVAYLVGSEIVVRLARDCASDARRSVAPASHAPTVGAPAYGASSLVRAPVRATGNGTPTVGEQQPERAADAEPGSETEREARLLRLVARYSTLPVPVPLVIADGMLAYRALRGVPLLSRSQDWRQARATGLGDVLGRFLASLRSIPGDSLDGIADVDIDPPTAWLTEAQECWEVIGRSASTGLPASCHRSIDTFLASPPPPQCDEMFLTHNDLGAEHVLVDPDNGEVTGVIDWTDAAITDPAVDLGLLLRDLGDGAFRAAARHLAAARHRPGSDPTDNHPTNNHPTNNDPTGLRDHAAFYARCRLLEDIRFGLEDDRPEYVANSVAAAERLFAG